MRDLSLPVVAFLALAICGCWHVNNAQNQDSDTDAISTVGPVTSTQLDTSVLNVVLNDLLTYTGDDSPVAAKGNPPNELLFDPESATYAQTRDEVMFECREEPWRNLTPVQLDSASQAASDLVKRIESKDLTENFQSSDKRISTDAAKDGFDRPIRSWPPGFSADNRISIVRMVIPWSMHLSLIHI